MTRMNNEYLSLGCGTILCLKGRTPIHCYSDYMRAFRDFGTVIFSVSLLWKFKLEWVQPEWFHTHLSLRKTEYGDSQELVPSSVTIKFYMLGSLKAAAENYGKPKTPTF
ncbi:putative beta-amylase [Helianthus annuus]|nr:putative beta-amylase [Helianthus annuus]KAJ0795968.1 putative beta-amylase [Helianthus annuus]